MSITHLHSLTVVEPKDYILYLSRSSLNNLGFDDKSSPNSMAPFTKDAILQRMADALPTHTASDDGSDLASSYEAVALLIHGYFSALPFKLRRFQKEKNFRM